MKSLIVLLLIFIFITPLLAKDPDPAAAQAAKSTPSTRASSKTEKEEVKDYKGFMEYNKKHAIVRTGDIGEIKLDKDGIRFPAKKTRRFVINSNKEKDEVGFLSTDRHQAGIFNLRDESFRILNDSGKEIKKTKLSKFPEGVVFAFSDTRIYAISPSFDGPGGFEIFTSSGQFLRWIDAGDVSGFIVPHTREYFLVTAGKPQIGDFFIMFDIDGNELWRHPIVAGWNAHIELSRDDRFVSIKVPEYWIKAKETDQHETVRKINKLYVIDIDNRQKVSEEDYAD